MALSKVQQEIGLSRKGIVVGTAIAFMAAFLFTFVGYYFGFLTAIERVLGPVFTIATLVFCLLFAFLPEKHLHQVAVLLKVFFGIMAIIDLMEGAFNAESNLEFYLIWIPVYYAALIFGATQEQQRRWGYIFFCVVFVSVLLALIFGPLGWQNFHSILLLSSLLGQFVLLVIFSELAQTIRTNEMGAARLIAVEENAKVLQYAAKAAEDSDRAKTAFIANASHELRTPLNAILGFAQILQWPEDMVPNKEKQLDYARTIESSARHMLNLINDFLDLAKIEAGKLELSDENINVADIFDEAETMLSPLMEKRSLRMETGTDTGLPLLIADRRALSQMVLNLASNAAKYTNQGDVIQMWAEQDRSGELRILVKDQGDGMDADTLQRVMKPFEQGKNAYTSGQGGTGLGLPLVQSLAELHDARFVLSSRPGEGTEATLVFPAHRVIKN